MTDGSTGANETQSGRPPAVFRAREIGVMLVLLTIGEAVGIAVAVAVKDTHPKLSEAFGAGAVALFFGALLGGIVTLLIGDFDRRRLRRASQLEYISNVLADLKSVYDRVDRGRTVITAHESAKTYGDEMREFIAARVKLRTVVRALDFDERRRPILGVRDEVRRMGDYLKSLTEEFAVNYKKVSRSQRVYEARMERVLDKANLPTTGEVQLPDNTPWAAIATLPNLSDFLKPVDVPGNSKGQYTSQYGKSFLAPLDKATDQLRQALSAELA